MHWVYISEKLGEKNVNKVFYCHSVKKKANIRSIVWFCIVCTYLSNYDSLLDICKKDLSQFYLMRIILCVVIEALDTRSRLV